MQILANYTENHLSSNFEDPWKHLVVKNNLYHNNVPILEPRSLATKEILFSRICNFHRWKNKLCEAEKRLFLMRCFAALRQWELQTPDPTRMCGDCKSPQTWGGEGFGIRSGFLRDVFGILFLREFRCLPYCAVAPEECCYRHTILCWKCVAVMLVRLIA